MPAGWHFVMPTSKLTGCLPKSINNCLTFYQSVKFQTPKHLQQKNGCVASSIVGVQGQLLYKQWSIGFLGIFLDLWSWCTQEKMLQHLKLEVLSEDPTAPAIRLVALSWGKHLRPMVKQQHEILYTIKMAQTRKSIYIYIYILHIIGKTEREIK